MVQHGEEMRKKLDDFADGVTPCPQTAQEWENATRLGAQWKAYQEVRETMKAEFGDQLEGTPLGQRYDKVLDGKKGLARALEARIRPCNPPKSAIKAPQEILQLVAHMIEVEKGLAGILPLTAWTAPTATRSNHPRKARNEPRRFDQRSDSSPRRGSPAANSSPAYPPVVDRYSTHPRIWCTAHRADQKRKR